MRNSGQSSPDGGGLACGRMPTRRPEDVASSARQSPILTCGVGTPRLCGQIAAAVPAVVMAEIPGSTRIKRRAGPHQAIADGEAT